MALLADACRRAVVAATSDRVAVLDATFGKRWQRELLQQHPNIRCIQIELETSEAQIRQRLHNRGRDEISDARLEDFEMLNAAYDPPAAMEQAMRVASAATLELTVTELLHRLVRAAV